jgi:hypothetical protein
MIIIAEDHKEELLLLNTNRQATNGWLTIRLIRVGVVPAKWGKHKQGCWLGWNPIEQRLAENHDTKWLRKRRPDILAWVEHQLRNTKHDTMDNTLVLYVPKNK